MAYLVLVISFLLPNCALSTLFEDMQKAIAAQDEEKVTALLEAYAQENFQSPDEQKIDLLFCAVEQGNLSIINALLTHPIFKNFDEFSLLAPPPSAIDTESHKLKKLHRLKRKLKGTKSLGKDEGALHKDSSQETLRKSRVFKTPYYIPGGTYFSLLHCATFAKKPSVVAYLLEHGHESQLLQQNEEGDNPLHIACMHHDKATLLALLGTVTVGDFTTDNHYEQDRYLSLALAQYNNVGRQPLHELLLCKKKEPAELLLHLLIKNANPCAPVFLSTLKTPFALALEREYYDCVGILSLTPNILFNDKKIWHYLLSKIEKNINPWCSILENCNGKIKYFNTVACHVMSLKARVNACSPVPRGSSNT